ncbi:YebO family protein [Winslowiella iniecta]|uniref:YebO family protein n=1 Tax=Winslowiella iniecta TaxID=1560201 RepID=A0A0L7T0N5_9GAMM|nr:YebO family protein [Winslowiella iniecta]KOC89014.1 hypothetical protein NG42_14140 [Winslowiella iniecta]KOC92662.1 hypothetical protein NG43_12965 [Winslowiella iniecta]
MNEMANGVMGIASMGFIAALVIVGLIAWFFINRASVRASEQIRLLEALLDEQKKQNALLRRLTDNVSGSEKKSAAEQQDQKDFTRLIPER